MKSHLGTYLAHYAAGLAGLAALVAGYQPSALPFLGPHGAAVVGGASAVVALLHAFGASPPSSDTLSKIAPAIFLPLLVLIPCALPACTTVSGWINSPSAQPVIVAAVDVAVATAEQRGVSPVQINSIAKQALTVNRSTNATLATVSAVVNSQLERLNLPPGDLAAAQILEVALAAEIQARIGTNADLAAARAAVADVLNAVIEVTGG